MGNVDDCAALKFAIDRRHQKRPARLAKTIDHRHNLFLLRTGDIAKFLQWGGATDPPVVRSLLGQRLEQLPCQSLLLHAGCLGVNLVGVTRQRLVHAAGRFVVSQIQRFVLAVISQPAVPCPHQGVLHDRQLVRIVAKVVEQALNQTRRNVASTHPYRPLDGGLLVLTI